MTDETPMLAARNLVKTYDGGRVRALDDVSLTIGRGEFVSVIGPSGSGKSTLLHMLGALERPDSGSLSIDGRDLADEARLDRVRARWIGFVFQLNHLIPTLSAIENVELPLMALRVKRADRAERARAMLDAVGLTDRAGHRPSELSGGQRQRVAIARALVNEPKIVLADEPTGDLDQAAGRRIMDLLEKLRGERELTIAMVTHDLGLAAEADRTIRILDGRVVQQEPA